MPNKHKTSGVLEFVTSALTQNTALYAGFMIENFYFVTGEIIAEFT